jgi:choline/glycine/proline betaine transport protein
LGQYLHKLPALSTYLAIESEGNAWQAEWTFFYWGWWISWSPFVGVFVARISRGRTIREFITCVLLVPTLATVLWLSIYGGTALEFLQAQEDFPVDTITETPSRALHILLGYLPGGWLWGPFATLLIVTFFVTSSDSGSLVDDIVTSGGHPNPPRIQRVFWAVSEGLVAITLLIAGGLQALQTASLTVGLPMAGVLLVTVYGLWLEMRGGGG